MRSSKKRQTRLPFSPVGSSSPAAAQILSHPRDRAAAAVPFDGSPSPTKKRKMATNELQLDEDDFDELRKGHDLGALPTPERSSQFIARSTSARKSNRGVQGKLDFGLHGAIEREKVPRSPSVNTSVPVKAPRRSRSGGIFGGRDTQTKMIELSSDSDSDEEEAVVPAAGPSKPRKQSALNTRSKAPTRSLGADERDESEEEELPTPRRNLRSGHTKPKDGSFEDELSRRRLTRSAQKPKGRRSIIISSGDESDSNASEVGAPEHDHVQSIWDIGEAEGSDDEPMRSSPPRRTLRNKGKGKASAPRQRRVRADSFEVSDNEEIQEEDEEDDVQPVPRNACRKIPQSDDEEASEQENKEEEEEEEDDDDIITSQRKRLAPKRRLSRREKDDLEDDLEFLNSSQPGLGSNRRAPKLNARQQALERLKRRRAGQIEELSEDEDEDEEERPLGKPSRVILDEDDDDLDEIYEDLEDEVEDGDDEVDGNRPRSRFYGAHASSMFQEDENDEDFVVEDEEGPLGAPAQLPLEFSSTSRMKARDLFKYAIEWMVQKKINPAFAIDDDIYDLTFRKLNDEVKGLAGSKFTSSVWLPDFTRALKARPVMAALELSPEQKSMMMAHCEACNRKSHPATWSINFSGKPYNFETLEDLSDEEDDDEDEGGDAAGGKEYDADGHSLPDQDKSFYVGVVCKTNAEIAHTLEHWRYHLNDWVIDYLKAQGYLAAEKLVERDSWNTKKRFKYANEIVDEMERKGEIKQLYNDFRFQIDYARDAKQQKFTRWGR